jgi:putative ABC transport system substrate-binding protein
MRSLGYVDGENVSIDDRSAPPQQLGIVALELVRSNVDVICAGSSAGVRAAMNATRSIPVVALDLESDPVASGFASTLARPAGNLTGFFLDFPEFSAKRLELIKEMLPGTSHVAILWDSSMDRTPLTGMESAARALNMRVHIIEVRDVSDFEVAFKRAVEARADIVMVMPSPRLDGSKAKIMALANSHHLPIMALFAHYASDGALLTYGPNIEDMNAREASYVVKILKGTRPGDLPIQRPEKFDFVLNLRTAKVLGISVPQSVVARADEIIQ